LINTEARSVLVPMKEERKQRQAQKAIDGAAGLAEYQAAAAAT